MSARRISRGAFAGAAAATGASIATPAQAQIALPQASMAAVGPMSGSDRQLGDQFFAGVRASLDDANGTRGLMDRFWMLRTGPTIKIRSRPPCCSRTSRSKIRTSSLAIGALNGKITDQVARYYSESGMPLIIPATTLDSITTHGYRGIFRLPTKDSVEGILHADYVKREKRGTRIAVLYQDGDYGFDVANGFLQRAHANGLNPFDLKFARDKPDFSAVARSVVAQNPDLAFLAGIARDIGPIVPALRQAGFKGAFDGSAAFFDGGLWPSYGNAIDGVIVSTSMPPLQIVPSAYSIKNEFEQRYGPMSPISAFAYAATQIFVAAVRRAQSTARQVVALTISRPIAFDTLVGSFTFDPFGDPNDPNVYFYQLSSGNWRYLRAAHPSSFIVR